MNLIHNVYNLSSYETLQKAIWLLEIPFDPIISLFTQCVADFLCLETLKHGTSLGNYLNIRVHGADPKHGGKIGGSSSASNSRYMKSSKGYFYVFKDSGIVKLEFPPLEMQIEGDKVALNAFKREILADESLFVTFYIEIPIRTKVHAMMSGCMSDPQSSTVAKVKSTVFAFFTPTINVRFIPEELDLLRYDQVASLSDDELAEQEYLFQEDEDFAGMAWKTKKAINVDHIGLYGIISQGLKGDLIGRIRNNPAKCLSGALRFIALSIIFRGLFIGKSL